MHPHLIDHFKQCGVHSVIWRGEDLHVLVPKGARIEVLNQLIVEISNSYKLERFTYARSTKATVTQDFLLPRETYIAQHVDQMLVRFPTVALGFLIHENGLFLVEK